MPQWTPGASVAANWGGSTYPVFIFSKNDLYPLTVGVGLWAQRAQNSGSTQIFPLVVIGGLVTIVPLIALFLLLQRYWRSGLLLGSLAN
jgi:multiple sugar transport system permease protein